MKFIISALFVIALATLGDASSATYGRRNNTDYLLARDQVYRGPQYNTYQTVKVDFPKPGQTNTRTITAIYVYDRFTNSSGAQPSLWSGGPGWRFASVNLKSQYGRGINSTVEFYGK